MISQVGLSSVILVATIGACIFKFILWPALLSPLAKIPNAHPTAPFSPLWILWTRYKGRELSEIHEAHKRSGAVVRLGPSELSVNCVDQGIRTIYAGGFEKHDWYPRVFHNYGHPNMFSMAQSKPHSVRRRMFTNVYAKSYLQTSSALAEITDSVINQRMLPRLLSATWSNPAVNVFELMAGVAMDIVTSYEFGLSAGTNFTQNEKACRHYLDLYHGRHSYTFYPQEIPLTTSFLEKMGIRFVPRFVSASNDELEAQCLKMCDDASAVLDRAQTLEISKGDYPIVYAQLRSALIDQHDKSGTGPSSPSPNEQQLELASEMFDHLAAGFDTSSITLTYLLLELSQRPQLQAQLRLELLTLAPSLQFSADHPVVPQSSLSSSSSPPAATSADVNNERLPPARGVPSSSALPRFNHKAIDALPLLHALALETLRRHPAIPGPQPRITPAGSKPCELAGYAGLPAGVRVSAQAYSLHRNEDVFPEPEVWRPERWREAGEEQLREMQRWFWAFGSGGRMCVGSNLAMLQMKAIVAAIYTNFTTSIADDTGIEQEESYTARPKARRLMIRFATVD